MSFNDEIDQVEGLLSRIGDGFLEMRTSLQHIHELNASLDEISVGCDKEKNALMQEMLAKGDSRASQSQLDTLRSLEQRLHNLQRLEALPHWEWQQWPQLADCGHALPRRIPLHKCTASPVHPGTHGKAAAADTSAGGQDVSFDCSDSLQDHRDDGNAGAADRRRAQDRGACPVGETEQMETSKLPRFPQP